MFRSFIRNTDNNLGSFKLDVSALNYNANLIFDRDFKNLSFVVKSKNNNRVTIIISLSTFKICLFTLGKPNIRKSFQLFKLLACVNMLYKKFLRN